MDNLEQQIQDFWENRTSPGQRRELLRQMEESGMEWKEFMLQYYNKVIAGEEVSVFSDEQKSRVWQRLKEQHAEEKKVVLPGRVVWLPWMAAACVLLVVGLCIYWAGGNSSSGARVAERPQPQPAAAKMIVNKNNSAVEETLTLPDHSLVQLTPGSSISYMERFEGVTRNIQLEGRALFDVAKDSAKPFTVTARGYATTALATKFIVDASRPVVYIRLLTGKIVVNATADASVALQKMYLMPGQELRINTTTRQFARITPDTKQSHNKTAESSAIAALSFERTSLPAVFQQLSKHYNIPILFDKAAVQDLSFTGAFEPSDNLELALTVICNMNQLTFTKENDHIVISKQ